MKLYKVIEAGHHTNPGNFWFTSKVKAEKRLRSFQKSSECCYGIIAEHEIDISKKGILFFLNTFVAEDPC